MATHLKALSTPKPFLRWAGSKRKLVGALSSYWNNDFRRYIEPFMGSACLYFEICPPKAVLSDINKDLVNTFLAIRDSPKAVFNRLSKINHGKASYLSLRKVPLRDLDAVDAAAVFVFLNRYCFNGLYRTNLEGTFNVPFAHSGTGKLPGLLDLRTASIALERAKIKHSDFQTILENAKEGDFFYLDPPYAVGNRRIFRQYDPSSFGLDDLNRLSKAIDALDSKKAKFVLSYAFCPEALKAFDKWRQRKVFIQRNIAGFATHRRRAAELLITNISE